MHPQTDEFVLETVIHVFTYGLGTDRPRIVGKRPGEQTVETIVYDRCCRIGGKLTLDDLVETSEVGDWKMPDFKAAGA